MKDLRRKKRSQRQRRALDARRDLRTIKGDIAMLDRILEAPGSTRSVFDDRWIEGCREGMAIAYDLIAGGLQDIAVRGGFKGKPIRVRYCEGAKPTVKDDSLIIPGA